MCDRKLRRNDRCPGAGALTSFNAGGLTKAERTAIVTHLAGCLPCRDVVLNALEKRAMRSGRILRGVAGLTILSCVLTAVSFMAPLIRARHRDSAKPVIEAQARRATAARITGVAWLSAQREVRKPFDIAADGLHTDTAPAATHQTARAALLSGKPDEAVTLLARIAEQARDATVWSDLAAAYIASAEKSGSIAPLTNAVAAADAALEILPLFAPALFNRALAVHRLGLRDSARDAWRAYLGSAPRDQWTTEAHAYLKDVSAPELTFAAALQQYRTIRASDQRAVANLVESFPDDARAYALGEVLTRWAKDAADDLQKSRDALSEARAFGRALATRGDFLIDAYVDGVERAPDSLRERLARAQSELTKGRGLMQAKQPTSAEASFREALRIIDYDTPLEAVIRRNLATSLYEQNRVDEAQRELEEALSRIPRRYTGTRAEILWVAGLCHSARNDWGDAIRSFRESIALFDSIREPYNAAVVRHILAQVYDTIGDSISAWTLRMIALPHLGRTTTVRTQTCLASVSRQAALARKWRLAASFLNLEIEISSRIQDPPSRADALLRRAVARHYLGRVAESRHDLAAAGTVIAAMHDEAYRARASSDRLSVEALVSATAPEAIEKLTAAIDFHRNSGRRMFLPTLYLRRGLALREMGDRVRAERDFNEGLAEVETSRNSLPDVVTRLGALDFSEELFIAAIDEALRRGDPAAALHYSERSRARALLETVPRGSSRYPRSDIAVISYVSLHERLVAFIVNGNSVTAITLGLTPAVAAGAVRKYRVALKAGRQPETDRVAQVLFHGLVAPVLPLVETRSRLMFVPDVHLASLPFAALRAPNGRYLSEDYIISKAPSLAISLRLQDRVSTRPPENLCVVAARPSGHMEYLPGAAQEARAISSLYAHTDLLVDGAATVARFGERAPRADIIHVAGHGTASSTASDVSALLLSGEERLIPGQVESMTLHRNPVVVLAACETDLGESRWTEGTLSVARAFIAAGAASVVATLATIDDAPAAQFFIALHHRLVRGDSAAEALQKTQVMWIKSGRPVREWAAIEVIGL